MKNVPKIGKRFLHGFIQISEIFWGKGNFWGHFFFCKKSLIISPTQIILSHFGPSKTLGRDWGKTKNEENRPKNWAEHR